VNRSHPEDSSPWLTTGELSRITRIPQQTLITWDRSGVLKASRPGRRSSARAPRRYDEAAVAAALFARSATQMGFKGDTLAQMLRLMQSGDRERLERAGLYTYRTYPGMMAHVFSADLGNEDDRRWVAHLRENGALVGEPTSLWTIREQLVGPARKLIRMPEFREITRPEAAE
jgi:DNA-binding transcriptional MerR regulator